ncbi:hypothetical protein MSC49_16060 [Methylosinus sp. C49]|uniref:type II toxin-antitoxin system RelE/ParE family toxin n=1 Tax=Methylosinus sp. C49 TaxID=2699395 RepID=UPI0013672B53|nr:type II toxin-antitoxin system RelE/ParE family toxin [Methylosinus sp. C49]BBU61671.1 hypothetical protein MSC49_16060 [Methylosinus sp. C49]
MAVRWTFRAYVSPSGRKDVWKWYLRLPVPAQAEFDALLAYLVQREKAEWRMPDFKLLTGRLSGIGELRFNSQKVEYRPFGIFGPNDNEFTLLIGCSKKSSAYTPQDARETAAERATLVRALQVDTHLWEDDDEG